MQLAMYKGPPSSICHKLAHWLTCLFTISRYSHCELVIDGRCFSSSARDGGVRSKQIDLESGHWDLFPIDGDEAKVRAWFRQHDGQKYDWRGVFAFMGPDLRLVRWWLDDAGRWFCSEACAAALGLHSPETYDPQELLDRLVEAF